MLTRRRMGSPKIYAVSIDIFLHNESPEKASPISRSPSQPFLSRTATGTRGCVVAQNACMGGPEFPTRLADYWVVTKGASPQRSWRNVA